MFYSRSDKFSQYVSMHEFTSLPSEAENRNAVRVQRIYARRERMPKLWKNNKCAINFVLDFICLAFVGLPVIIFFAIGKPFKRGFYCDDESIRYPYRDSTISNKVLYCVGVLFPAFVITTVEILRYYTTKTDTETPFLGRYKIHPIFWEIYQLFWVFAFGAFVSQLTTDIAKYSIGRLRPHFIDICKPDINVEECNNSHRYILPSEFHCLNSDTFRVRESRLSFMSGHASFSAYCMVFLAMYLQSRFTWDCNKLLRPILQVILLFAAYYTALSRVSDYKHHWSDVLTGSIQGTIVAIIVVLYVSNLFPKQNNKDNCSTGSDESSGFTRNKENPHYLENARSSV